MTNCKCGYGKHYPQKCKCWLYAKDVYKEVDKDGWPKRWSSKTYLGDGPWGA